MNIPDFVIDINGYIGTPDTVLPYTMAYYIKHGYKERQLNIKLINKLTNKQTSYSYGGRLMLYLPGETTLAELWEIKATCRDCCTLDGCDDYCHYWRFNVDDCCCAFGHLGQPLEWDLPEMLIMED